MRFPQRQTQAKRRFRFSICRSKSSVPRKSKVRVCHKTVPDATWNFGLIPVTPGMHDEINNKLLAALQNNARASFAELGRAVGLTPPAVAERVRRLEEDGLIRGYRADVDYSKLGYTISAFIRMKVPPGKYP